MQARENEDLEDLCTFGENPLNEGLEVPVVHTARITYEDLPGGSQEVVQVVGKSVDGNHLFVSYNSRVSETGASMGDFETAETIPLEQVERYEILSQTVKGKSRSWMTWRQLGLGVGGIALLSTVIGTGINFYAHHNVFYETGRKKAFEKIDGPYAHTKLEVGTEGSSVRLWRSSLFSGYKYFCDLDGDGMLDRLRIEKSIFARGSSALRQFTRGQDGHLPIFKEAQKEYQEQIRRFRSLREHFETNS